MALRSTRAVQAAGPGSFVWVWLGYPATQVWSISNQAYIGVEAALANTQRAHQELKTLGPMQEALRREQELANTQRQLSETGVAVTRGARDSLQLAPEPPRLELEEAPGERAYFLGKRLTSRRFGL